MELNEQLGAALDRIYAAFTSGDPSLWDELLSPDVVVIGTDEREWWQGRDEVLPVLRAQQQEMTSGGIRFVAGPRQIASSTDTAWAAERATLQLPDGPAVPMRITAVATAEDGRLRLRQLHLSVGAPNEDVLSQTLTV